MKKILAMMLAVMMLIVPAMSLAAQTVSVSLQHGTAMTVLGLGEMADAINQLIDMVGLQAYSQGDDVNQQAGISLTLNGEVAATAELAKKGSEVYAVSNLLGSTVVATQEEVNALIDAMVQDAEQAANVKEMLNGFFSGEMFAESALDLDELLSSIDLTAALKLIEDINARAEVTEVTEPLEGCDPAATKIAFTMTADELNTVVNSVVKSFLESDAMKQAIASLEQQGMQVNLTFDELKLTEDVPVEIYLDAEGDLVCLLANTSFKNEEGNEMAEKIMVTRLTDEAGAVTLSEVIGLTKGDEEMTVAFVLTVYEDDNVSFSTNVSMQQEELMSIYGSVVTVDNVSALTLFVSVNDNGETMGFGLNVTVVKGENNTQTTIEILPQDGSEAYITIVIDCATVEDFLSIASADAVHLLTLSSEEMEAFMETVSQTAMTQLITVLQKLPEEVLALVMQ